MFNLYKLSSTHNWDLAYISENIKEIYNKIEIYNLALGQLGEDEVILSKLSLDLGNKISEYYFIEDMDAFKKATDNIEFESVALVSQIDWLNNLGLDNFYYCIRK